MADCYNGLAEMTQRNRMERQQLLGLVKTLRSSGKTIRTIATELGIHRSSVHRAVKALARLGAGENPLRKKKSAREVERPVAISSFADAAFVGRQREMERLSNALGDAMLGRPNIRCWWASLGLARPASLRS